MNQTLSLLIKPAFADEAVPIGQNVDTNFFKFRCIGDFVTYAVNAALIIGGIAFFVMLVLGALQWLNSGGDKNSIEQARSRLTNALIGIGVLAASWALWTLAMSFFGIEGDICNLGSNAGGGGGGIPTIPAE